MLSAQFVQRIHFLHILNQMGGIIFDFRFISLPIYKTDTQRLVTQYGCEYEYFGGVALFCANEIRTQKLFEQFWIDVKKVHG